MMRVKRRVALASMITSVQTTRGLVSLHGSNHLSTSFRMRHTHYVPSERPTDPNLILADNLLFQQQVDRLLEWWSSKQNVLALTGAGLSTDSGIPDYRGHNGSYHRGHKPMIHEQFMNSESQRKRYWGRSMIGWKSFDEKKPNEGHYALATLEQRGVLGVSFEDQSQFYDDPEDFYFSSGQRSLALVTQNVDALHRRAGSRDIIELHGRGGLLKCMSCGATLDRNHFHEHLKALNSEWLETALSQAGEEDEDMRPDGDAAVTMDFECLEIPSCQHCGGFMKPDVVFFGDTVPMSRVAQVTAAVEHCDGLLVVGSSLAVHSAFRHVRAACKKGTPIAILNVGETRAETEKLPGILKINSPAGATLSRVASAL